MSSRRRFNSSSNSERVRSLVSSREGARKSRGGGGTLGGWEAKDIKASSMAINKEGSMEDGGMGAGRLGSEGGEEMTRGVEEGNEVVASEGRGGRMLWPSREGGTMGKESVGQRGDDDDPVDQRRRHIISEASSDSSLEREVEGVIGADGRAFLEEGSFGSSSFFRFPKEGEAQGEDLRIEETRAPWEETGATFVSEAACGAGRAGRRGGATFSSSWLPAHPLEGHPTSLSI